MKVTKQVGTTSFKPYTISIEVTSEEDERILQAIIALDVTIPDETYPDDEYLHAAVTALLQGLQKEVG